MEKNKIAIIYDFDGTLAPGNMQEYDFIPAVGKKNEEFWCESTQLAEEQDGDPILAYMYRMIQAAKSGEKSLRREAFRESGSKVELFEGVVEWFSRINKYAAKKGLKIEHYINSSGIKEMIEGTKIAGEFKKIFACSFFYDVDGIAYWPSVVVNYTTKTQFLFKINKGIDSISDNILINNYVPESERPIPFSRMIYIGDGYTDIPCMKLVKQMGGYSIAVYNSESQKKIDEISKLLDEGRVDYTAKADYTSKSKIDKIVHNIIDKIAAEANLEKISKDNECEK
ncbi:MAG: HAD family hydrolase [Rikenellaceae bacterium]